MVERLGDLLIRKQLINPAQLDVALKEQAQTGQFLGEIFIRLGYINEPNLLTVLAEQFNTRFVSLDKVRINPSVIKLVPRELVLEYKFLPIEMRSGVLLIAVSNPLDMWPLSVIQKKMTLTEVQIVLATKTDIQQYLEKFYSGTGPG